MTANVITIARTLGANGEEVGRAVGYRFVDDEIITLAAQRAVVDAAEVARVEGRRRMIDKVVRALAMGGRGAHDAGTYVTLPFDGATYVEPGLYPLNGSIEAMIMDVVAEVSAEGQVVVVAHGGGRVLRAHAGVLRCMVTAPEAVRASRVAGGKEAVSASDKARQDFFRRFFNDTEHHDDYDLVLNTQRLTVEASCEVVVCLAQAI
jgi:hypothetical protein